MAYFRAILDAEYRNDLSEGILQLQESGKLAALKIKWWKEKRGGGACQVSFHRKHLLFIFNNQIHFNTIEKCLRKSLALEFMGINRSSSSRHCQVFQCDNIMYHNILKSYF